MMRPADPRIDAYLRQLDYALSHLPWEQRQEIFTDVSAHIEREFATSGAQGVNDLLSRLGDPRVIAAEAGAPPMPPRGRGLEITAVILIAVGGFVVPFIGWIVGVVLVWVSSRFTKADKWIATLVPPFGLLTPFVFVVFAPATTQTCTTGTGVSTLNGAPSIGTPVFHTTCTGNGSHLSYQILGGLVSLVLIGCAIYTIVRLARRVARMS